MARKTISYKGYKPSSKKSSFIASRIKSKDTLAEILLRRKLWKLGLRFRKNVKDLPGKPDIVFIGAKIAIFCDGDFWHGKNWEKQKTKLENGSNSQYWLSKIEYNMNRDKRYNEELELANWIVLRFWESDIIKNVDMIAAKIEDLLKFQLKKV